jgi:hypothetical protein
MRIAHQHVWALNGRLRREPPQVSVMGAEILVKQVSVIGYCGLIGYLPQTNLVLEKILSGTRGYRFIQVSIMRGSTVHSG